MKSARLMTYCLLALSLLLTAVEAQKPGSAKKADTPEAMKRKIERLEQQIHLAKLEMAATEISVMMKERTAASGLGSAEFKLQAAREALEHFDKATAPTRIRQEQVSLDESKNRAELAKAELDELIAMYKADEFAEMTKELVLKRGRRKLEFAERRLAIQAAKFDHLQTNELPRQRKDLTKKVEDAEQALENSRLEIKKAALDAEVGKTKARFKVSNLEQDLGDARRKLDKISAKTQ